MAQLAPTGAQWLFVHSTEDQDPGRWVLRLHLLHITFRPGSPSITPPRSPPRHPRAWFTLSSSTVRATVVFDSELPVVGGLPFSLSVVVALVSHGWRYPPFTVASSTALCLAQQAIQYNQLDPLDYLISTPVHYMGELRRGHWEKMRPRRWGRGARI